MEPYLGEIRAVGFNFAPEGWLACNGALVNISEYEALYSLVGTTYGGDGQSTFALPDLRSRLPVGQGSLAGGSNYTMGQQGGSESVTPTLNQLPTHTHTYSAAFGVSTNGSGSNDPAGNLPGTASQNLYASAATAGATLEAGAVAVQLSTAGNSQPHENRMPTLAINFIICTEGIYPSRG